MLPPRARRHSSHHARHRLQCSESTIVKTVLARGSSSGSKRRWGLGAMVGWGSFCGQLHQGILAHSGCGNAHTVTQVKKINEFTDTLVTDLRSKLRNLNERASKETTEAGKAQLAQVSCRPLRWRQCVSWQRAW